MSARQLRGLGQSDLNDPWAIAEANAPGGNHRGVVRKHRAARGRAAPEQRAAQIVRAISWRMSLKLKETVPEESSRLGEGKLDRYGLG